MKVLAAFATCFLACAASGQGCIEVTTAPPPRDSFPVVRVVVKYQDKTLAGVGVNVALLDGPSSIVIKRTTDEKGELTTPVLAPGLYSVALDRPRGLAGALYLRVTSAPTSEMSTFTLELNRDYDYEIAQKRLAAARKQPPTERLPKLSGVLMDQAGAFLPSAKIEVWQEASKEEDPFIESKSSDKGEFSVPLPNGIYVARIQQNGFRDVILVFELSQDAPARALKIEMKIKTCP